MDENGTLVDLIESLARHGDHPALVAFADEVQTWSYADLGDEVRRLAAGLDEIGIEPGTRVVLFAANSPGWIIANLALLCVGAVPVPLDVRLGAKQLAHCLKDSDSRFAFSTAAAVPALRERHPDGEALTVISLDAERPGDDDEGEDPNDADEAARMQHWWRDLLAEKPVECRPAEAEDTAVLFYTSGTTGAPKGVPLTHRNIVPNIHGLLALDIIESRERILLPLPLHHVYPYVLGTLAPLAQGSSIVLPAGISGPEIVRALGEGKVTMLLGVPRLYQTLMAAIRRRIGSEGGLVSRLFEQILAASAAVRQRTGWDVGRVLFRPVRQRLAPDLDRLASAGAKLDAGLAARLEGLGWEVLSGYGLTETSPIVAVNAGRRKDLASAGKVLRGVDVKIEPLEEKEGGEITVKGPNVFGGYRNLEDKTEESFTDDGYFRTGDIGHLDDAGRLYVTARVKETIVLPAGENIYPEDVEEPFLESPLIEEAAVLEHEERLTLLVVPDKKALRERDADDEQAAIEAEVQKISDRLPSYQRVAEVALTSESLPRTTLGKLRRHELPALLDRAQKGEPPPEDQSELSAADEALLAKPKAKRTWEWLEERFPDQRFTPNSSLFNDVGVDSLDWVGLSLDLEREVGVSFDEATISRIETVRDLLEAVEEAESGDGEKEPAKLSPEQEEWLEPRGPLAERSAAVLVWLGAATIRGLCRLEVEGQERLPKSGPFILAPNHTSYLDAPAVLAALPEPLRRKTFWAGDHRIMFKSAPRRLASRLFNVFPVDPMRARTTLAFGKAVLERDRVLAWFPEGRRSKDGSLLPFEPGIGQLAHELGVPIVPVHIEGTHEAWPVGQALPRPRPVRVRFGEPLQPQEAIDEDEAEPRRQVVDAVHDRVAELAEAAGDGR